jgi:hypothetical protein
MTLEEIINGCTQRLPQNLVKDHANKRHQKVVDEASGEIVGYARWILPKGFEHSWPEAQISEPSAEEYEKYEAQWGGATVNGQVKGSNRAMVVEMSGPLDERRSESSEVNPTYVSIPLLLLFPRIGSLYFDF